MEMFWGKLLCTNGNAIIGLKGDDWKWHDKWGETFSQQYLVMEEHARRRLDVI